MGHFKSFEEHDRVIEIRSWLRWALLASLTHVKATEWPQGTQSLRKNLFWGLPTFLSLYIMSPLENPGAFEEGGKELAGLSKSSPRIQQRKLFQPKGPRRTFDNYSSQILWPNVFQETVFKYFSRDIKITQEYLIFTKRMVLEKLKKNFV